MENELQKLSKQELIQYIIKIQKQKADLINQLQSKVNNQNESPPIIEKQLSLTDSFFSETFSQGYYLIQNNGRQATWLKGSNNILYQDYNLWPTVRTNELITGVKTFKLRIMGYGWIGLGSVNMRNDGFPGFTTEGWMLCTDGRVYHNKVQTSITHAIKFQNRLVTITVDAAYSEISVDGVPQRMGHDLPKEVYFVVSIYGPRAAYVEVES